MKLFTLIFSDITDTFCLDIERMARCIDRDSSRIRHWRKDTIPSKKIMDKLFQTVCSFINESHDPYTGKLFVSKMNAFFSSTKLFTPDITQQLTQITTLDSYVQFLLQCSYSCDVDVTHNLIEKLHSSSSILINSDYPADTTFEFEYSHLCTEINDAHHNFEIDLLKESESTYLKLLSSPIIKKYPKEHVRVLIDLGYINRKFGKNELQLIYFQTSIEYHQEALLLINELKDRLQYAHVNAQLGDTYFNLS